MPPRTERSQPIALADTWRRYKRTDDQSARNRLILAYSPLVKYVAGRMASTDAELAAQMSMEPEELDASLQRVGEAHMVALDQPWDIEGNDGFETTLLETLPDRDAADPAASADAAELRERIAHAILHLPERERAVLGLRYHQDLRFAEIGEIMGVTESRISQLHAKAVLQVRALLPDGLEPAAS
jgi:RNA polymerase sigma factor for flagellar operon FliA